MESPDVLASRLAERRRQGLGRTLRPRAGIDLCSNDYLGFAQDETLKARFLAALQDAPLGATASRLVRGNSAVHERVESSLATFCGRERALLFPSGYQANVGLLTALLHPEDAVFSDERNHASIIDGIRLSGANRYVYPHLDTGALEAQLAASDSPFKVVVTETLFSMDGDLAPLEDIGALCRRYGARLVVDEAHATGMYGAGLATGLDVLASVHTGGKALGASGAWIAADASTIEYLISFCRPFIYTTAPLPAQVHLLGAAVEHWQRVGPARATEVRRRAACVREALGQPPSDTPIVPIVAGTPERALALEARLSEAGYDCRAIRPPTVPQGTSRLRMTVTWPVPLERLLHAVRLLS